MFEKRHSDISLHISQLLVKRKSDITQVDIENWFRRTKNGSFKLPIIEDIGDITFDKVEKTLLSPITGSTRR